MTITPDSIIVWQWGGLYLNGTIVFTWLVMGLLTFIAWLATRHLSASVAISRWQHHGLGYLRCYCGTLI